MIGSVGRAPTPDKNSEVLANLAYMTPGLSEARRQDLQTLLAKYPQVTQYQLGCMSVMEHTIQLEESMHPIAQGYYKVNPQRAKRIQVQVQLQLELGLIEKSRGPWASLVVLVPKEGGGDRLCIDFRKLNVCKFMPFGLKNAPRCFQQLMNEVLADIQNCVVYLDDRVFSKTWHEHLQILAQVQQAFQKASLVVNLKKCQFGVAKTTYLGHFSGNGKFMLKDANIQAIMEMPYPTTKKEAQQFMGMVECRRRFTPNLSEAASPITNLFKGNQQFHCTPECKKMIISCYEYGQKLIKILVNDNPSAKQEIIEVSSKVLDKKKIISDFPDLFEGLGELGPPCRINIDNTVSPVIRAPRKVPFALKKKLKKQLSSMESTIIEKVSEPTNWVSSMVLITKPNSDLRICLDPTDLNKAIRRPHYPLPTIEEILPRLEEYQRRMHDALRNLDGIEVIADDILVYGQGDTHQEALENHDKNLLALLQRCRQENVKLNQEKMKLHVTEVKYIGHLLTKDGVRPDPKKIEAINCLKAPNDVKSLKRFLGMVNYLSKFLPRLSEITQPLRNLEKKNVEWQWNSSHNEAFSKIKKLIVEAPCLKYFDSNCNVSLLCDASMSGLGALLMQNGHPVAYASKSLTETEQRYAQIEKEIDRKAISQTTYEELCHWSSFGILYGLPKVHKKNIPVRPSLSSYTTPNYKIAKFLVPLLDQCFENKYKLSNSLESKQSIVSQDSDLVMASFDVESLFTNVPVEETISFMLEDIFRNDDDVFQGFSKADFKKLLELAVRDTAFIFNDEVYVQVDGVGMGNPLSCTFADIFMFTFEQQLLDICPASFKPLIYRR
ncbi:uncharacterized protein [Macrobrachium rosenbergii]|uniref:uncharacterized protein n=1 Tax=Macrobrachium rosenbergii TaxID=79674 RepID=UPI0034D56670